MEIFTPFDRTIFTPFSIPEVDGNAGLCISDDSDERIVTGTMDGGTGNGTVDGFITVLPSL